MVTKLKLLFVSVVSIGMMSAAQAVAATPIADFELNGSLANSGTVGSITNNGGALGSTGITFGSNQGPTISGLGALSTYTIDTSFDFNDSGRYFKIVDFSGLASDLGVYSYFQTLDFYNVADTTNSEFTPGTASELTISRSAAGLVTGYVNGTSVLSYDDSSTNYFTIPGALSFFQDDHATGQAEADSGFVDYLRIYNTAITPDQALPAGPGAVSAAPEPGAWVLLLGGFGMLGGMMRVAKTRRREAELSQSATT